MKRLLLIFALLCGSALAQSNLYSAWSGFPQSTSYFPIMVWDQPPTRTLGVGSPFSTDAVAIAGSDMNVLMEIDNGGGGNYPASCNTDTGGMASALFAQGVDFIPLVSYTTNGSGCPGSVFDTVLSLQTIASNLSASSKLIGYNLGDEPQSGSGCTTLIPNLPTYLATATTYDTTRPFFWNFTDYVFGHGSCSGSPDPNIAAQKSLSVASFDLYPITAPWNGTASSGASIPDVTGTVNTSGTAGTSGCGAGTYAVTHASGSAFPAYLLAAGQPIVIGSVAPFTVASDVSGTVLCVTTNPTTQSGAIYALPQDSMWIQGYSVVLFRNNGATNQPIWAYVDTGTNELAYSSQNSSSCNATTNNCTGSGFINEYRATSEQVNAEVWMTLINGGNGIEFFCDDTSITTTQTAYDFCLGNNVSGEGTVAAAIASNLLYIDGTILTYAHPLNYASNGLCTMNNGTGYSNYTTSCTQGILTMSTGTSSVPGSAVVKTYSGTPYLFADSDRNGSALMTFTLSGYAGYTATVVYDSNAQYDPTHSEVGTTFTLNGSGQFSDTFGANGHNYQPKIYTITNGSAPQVSAASAAMRP
jgi:hypothetical protein